MDNNDYPDAPGYRHGSPETAKEAAASVADAAKSRSALASRFVLDKRLYGATADEVADAFEWERYSSRPRLAELHRRGVIADSGERRMAVSGRRQVVWIDAALVEPATDEGQGDLLAGLAA